MILSRVHLLESYLSPIKRKIYMLIHWGHCKTEITSGLDTYISKVCSDFSEIHSEHLVEWENKVLERVDLEIEKLKHKIKTAN